MNNVPSRSQYIALAKEGCALCHGDGLRPKVSSDSGLPCKCVLRAIFRACYRRFRESVAREKHVSHARLEQVSGKDRSQTWGMKNEEYIADFCIVSRRALTEEEYRIFKYHYLLGASWKLCCRRLNMEKGIFFHTLYRIQQKLGAVYRDLQPYPLFPLDEYFAPTIRKCRPQGSGALVLQMPSPARKNGLRPPLKKVA